MKKKAIIKWLKIAILIYIAGGIAIYFLQEKILFKPQKRSTTYRYTFTHSFREISIPMSATDTMHLVRFYRSDTAIAAKGLVLYLHGNRENIGRYAKYVTTFTQHGYDVLMPDYPGYGKSRGRLTENKLYNWSKTAYTFATTICAADSIIIYGKSLGTGLATHLASIYTCKRLILETPYYDFPSVMKRYLPFYPIKTMLKYQLPTYQYLPRVTVPVTIFHGTRDWVVDYKNSKRLMPYLKPGDELVTITSGGHNDLFSYKQVIKKTDSLLAN